MNRHKNIVICHHHHILSFLSLFFWDQFFFYYSQRPTEIPSAKPLEFYFFYFIVEISVHFNDFYFVLQLWRSATRKTDWKWHWLCIWSLWKGQMIKCYLKCLVFFLLFSYDINFEVKSYILFLHFLLILVYLGDWVIKVDLFFRPQPYHNLCALVSGYPHEVLSFPDTLPMDVQWFLCRLSSPQVW